MAIDTYKLFIDTYDDDNLSDYLDCLDIGDNGLLGVHNAEVGLNTRMALYEPSETEGSEELDTSGLGTADANNYTATNQATLTNPKDNTLKIARGGASNDPYALQQTTIFFNHRYHLRGEGRSDSNATPKVRTNFGHTLLTLTTSTDWQTIDLKFTAQGRQIFFNAQTSALGEYVEFRNLTLIEIDIPDSNTNIYSSDLNTFMGDKTTGTIIIQTKPNSVALQDLVHHTLIRIAADANNSFEIKENPTNNTIEFLHTGASTETSITKSGLTSTNNVAIITWDTEADEFKAYLNSGTPISTETGLGIFTGALAATLCNIGAFNTDSLQSYYGEILHCIISNVVFSDAEAGAMVTALNEDAFTLHHGQLDAIAAVNNWLWFPMGMLDEFTPQFISAEIHKGDKSRDQPLTPSYATIVLDSTDGPNVGINDFKHIINHRMQIIQTQLPNDGPIFSGLVQSAEVPDSGENTVILNCVGRDSELHEQHVTLSPATDQTADTIITNVLNQISFRLPKLDPSILVLDDLQKGYVDQRLGDMDTVTAFDSGLTTFPYVGDSWDNALAADIIRDAVISDQGFFYTGVSGAFGFTNRHTLIEQIGQLTWQSSTATKMNAIYGDKITNTRVSFKGRRTGDPNTTLFTIDEPLLIRPGQTRQIIARYRDTFGNPIGALVVDEVIKNINWTANNDGTTTTNNRTHKFTVTMISLDGRSAKFEVSHIGGGDLYLATFFITGTPLFPSDPTFINYRDMRTGTPQGIKTRDINAPLIATPAAAEDIARFETAREIFRTLNFKSATTKESDIIGLTSITLRVSLIQEFTQQTQTHIIIGETHEISATKPSIRTIWLDSDYEPFMVVGDDLPETQAFLTPQEGLLSI